jgi:ubiquinone/menaquinone biosynthesis C-methylase UbiE
VIVPGHDDRVRKQFASQAATSTDTGFATPGLSWILDTIAPTGTEVVLDVACGAAHLGALSHHACRTYVGLDLVPEMLEQARRLADASQLRNILLLRGDATDLPWVDQTSSSVAWP